MGGETPTQRPIGQQLSFRFDVEAGQSFRAELIVRQKSKSAEPEPPVQFIERRHAECLIDRRAQPQRLANLIGGRQLRIHDTDDVVSRGREQPIRETLVDPRLTTRVLAHAMEDPLVPSNE